MKRSAFYLASVRKPPAFLHYAFWERKSHCLQFFVPEEINSLRPKLDYARLTGVKGGMQLSDAQREMLCEMTNSAYVEIRQLAQAGRLEQGFDLAAVFHSLLNNIWSEDFDLLAFRAEILTAYQLKYPDATSANYVARVDQIIALGREGSPALNRPLQPEADTILPQLPPKDSKLPSGAKPE